MTTYEKIRFFLRDLKSHESTARSHELLGVALLGIANRIGPEATVLVDCALDDNDEGYALKSAGVSQAQCELILRQLRTVLATTKHQLDEISALLHRWQDSQA